MNDWRPIETAPDGVDVLLWNDGKVFVAQKKPKIWTTYSNGRATTDMWYSWDDVEATHWMPLPDMTKEQP